MFRALILFFLLLLPLPDRANPGLLRLPFRNERSLILVKGKINEKPATFVLDTGADRTIVSKRCYGQIPFRLQGARHIRNGAGMDGEYVSLPVKLTLGDHIWAGQQVSVMDLDQLQADFGISFDGLLGQDVLREFRTVRIDYHAQIIELEK